MIVRWSFAALICWICTAAVSVRADEQQRHLEFFETRIRPVLVEHCYECHSADAKSVRGGLLLDSRQPTRTGGDSGAAVVPGKPEESLLLEALRYESFEMPPSGKLPQHVIDDFQTWIEAGAADPRDMPTNNRPAATVGMDLEAGRQFWSFQPIQSPEVPAPQKKGWCDGDIDRFLLHRMEHAGLPPSADADRRTLIRRAYFDLIGLPPSPGQIADFLTDESPTPVAFARVVDELLDSPHFGERWGRHWLDVARYAESTGGGRSLLYRTSWRYRDYVINAFNADKPFDQFIIEQIAGDLLPSSDYRQRGEQLTATAFLALGPTNYELQDKEQLRMDVIDEQIDTVGRAFLGMTLGCARCHDHKFDPVPTTDYYALAGIFRSTKTLIDANVSSWVSQPLPLDPISQQRLERHKLAVATLEAKINQQTERRDELKQQLPEVTLDDADAVVRSGRWSTSSGVKSFVGEGYRYASGSGNVIEYRLPLKSPGSYDVRVSYSPHSNRSPDAPYMVTHLDGESTVRVDQRQPPSSEELYVSLGEFEFDREAVVTLQTDGASGTVIADAVQVLPVTLAATDSAVDGAVSTEDFNELRQSIAALDSEISNLKSEMSNLNKDAPPAPPETVVVKDQTEEEIGDYHVCIRGNAKNLGPVVQRGFLSVAMSNKPSEIPADVSGRLELAHWIASPENPLTARVAVNRVWHHLFGAGLVRTVDNFGTAGEQPSHPKLLDHLSMRFMEHGWSVKTLIRDIMLSHTYRLSSQPSATALKSDADNRLLSYHGRRRLDAEAIYDSILSLSGQLDPTVGGNTVRPETKAEYGYVFDIGRRALYLPVFRNRLPELFTVFDFPDPNLSTGRRTVSTLSTQALLLMNSPFVMEQAQQAAERLLATPEIDDHQRLELLYHRAVGRPPSEAERELATTFLADSDADDESDRLSRWTSLVQAVMASLDFRYIE